MGRGVGGGRVLYLGYGGRTVGLGLGEGRDLYHGCGGRNGGTWGGGREGSVPRLWEECGTWGEGREGTSEGPFTAADMCLFLYWAILERARWWS